MVHLRGQIQLAFSLTQVSERSRPDYYAIMHISQYNVEGLAETCTTRVGPNLEKNIYTQTNKQKVGTRYPTEKIIHAILRAQTLSQDTDI